MALLTGKGMREILRRIMETGGLTDDMEKDVQRLRDDFDEREGILRKFGEVYDGEDRDEYDWSEKGGDTNVYTPKEEEKDWKSEYDTLQKRYIDRFFQGVAPTEENAKRETERIINDQRSDIERDGTTQSFDELLYRTEGTK